MDFRAIEGAPRLLAPKKLRSTETGWARSVSNRECQRPWRMLVDAEQLPCGKAVSCRVESRDKFTTLMRTALELPQKTFMWCSNGS
jgi:hypothetical protein